MEGLSLIHISTGAFISKHRMTALNDPEQISRDAGSGLARYVAFAAGSGITPIMALIRHLLADLSLIHI